MGILTPTERREVERERRNIVNIRQYQGENVSPQMVIAISLNNADFWLNVFDLALGQNEALGQEWVKDLPIAGQSAPVNEKPKGKGKK